MTSLVRFVRRQPVVALAYAFLIFLCLCALVPSLIAPQSPTAQSLTNGLQPPLSDGAVLGTDELGRDVLSRLVWGSRIAVRAPLQAVGLALLVGIPLGLATGYIRGRAGGAILRLNDVLMSFPPLLLALSVIAILGPGLNNAMIAIGIIFAPTYVRLVRGVVMDTMQRNYVLAAQSLGVPMSLIIRRHIVRAIVPPVMVQISLSVGFAMLAEASLSFLGLGVAPPAASWGEMLSRGVALMDRQRWLFLWPGLCITVTVLAANIIADHLRSRMRLGAA